MEGNTRRAVWQQETQEVAGALIQGGDNGALNKEQIAGYRQAREFGMC